MKSHLTFFFPKFRTFPFASLTKITTSLPLSQKSPRRCRRLTVAVVSPLPPWLEVPPSPLSPKFTTPIALPLLTDVAIALMSPRRCRRLSAAIVGLSSTFEARVRSTSERLCLLASHRVRRPYPWFWNCILDCRCPHSRWPATALFHRALILVPKH
ncbi:hypothetical protein DEO72_LG4g254 [Vigna unguiculata]|uniref:Uncharacterized protein n=1 Tax=Vigna unguiculata TaxID=3917 RepID=A0A4D6LLB5_VIGUN|nr:hypothetical protein DEO72_LG4g254 [Vigna unguiculata]